jgi:signal transduction histidine kinase
LDNLIENALSYTSAGDHIYIQAKSNSDHLIVEVRDTGIGIPESELPRIFDRFYRGEKSRTRYKEGGGVGLGLAIVKSLVIAHGGNIHIESKPEEGTRFWFSLPKKSSSL